MTLVLLFVAAVATTPRAVDRTAAEAVQPGSSTRDSVKGLLGPPAREWRDWVVPGEFDLLASPSEPADLLRLEKKRGVEATPVTVWEYDLAESEDWARPVVVVTFAGDTVRTVHLPPSAGETPAAVARKRKATAKRVERTEETGHLVHDLVVDWFREDGIAYVRPAGEAEYVWKVRLPPDGSVRP